jgi:peptidoglycan hydrolase-like protein with peptidoglycan-binding domain
MERDTGRARTRITRGVQAAALAATAAGAGVAPTSAPAAAASCDDVVSSGEDWLYNCWVGYGYDTSGGYVNNIQSVLQATLYNPGCVDGIFGPNTQGALIDYQNDHPPLLSPTGYVGDWDWIAFYNERVWKHTNISTGDKYYAFGPWDPSQRHKDVAGDYQYTKSGSCSSSGSVWVKLAV